MTAEQEPVLGIDLGTSNSACAVVRQGRASVVRRGEDRIIPSVVAALPDGGWLVGERAKRRRAVDPVNVVFSAKRLIGRRFHTPEVQQIRGRVPYGIREGENESVMLEVGGRLVSVVEVSSQILAYLRAMAEEALGRRVRKTVIAVPANFTEAQRSATRIAARLAGLDVIRVINEPTAAALAYGYIEDIDRRIAVYDFGGGTFDVTILQITRNIFEVLATSGEMFLGGDDLDEAILGLMAEAFEDRYRIDPRTHPMAVERLRAYAEHLKIQLSEGTIATVQIPEVIPGRRSDFEFSTSEREIRPYIEPIIRRTVAVCQDALARAGLSVRQIDDIVLVGGTTRLPLVRQIVTEIFGQAPQTSINPMSVVAVGAAIQGAALLGSLVPMADGGISTASSTAVLLDVVPRSLGVRTVGGHVDFIIDRNQAIPVEQTRVFTTSADHQRHVRIQVCEGESEHFDANHKLGEVILSDLRAAPRGEVGIAVTFEINTDGLLEVRALDQETGQQQVASMTVLGGASNEEREAAQFSSHESGALEALAH